MCSAQREVSRDGAARGGFRATVHNQTFSGIIGCTNYVSAGENRRETQETQQKEEKETLVGETEEE